MLTSKKQEIFRKMNSGAVGDSDVGKWVSYPFPYTNMIHQIPRTYIALYLLIMYFKDNLFV